MIRIIVLLILAIGCPIVPLKAQAIDTLFLHSAIKKLQHAREYTLKIAELMPSEFYQFEPSASEMHFAEQLLHLSANLGWLSSSYLMNEDNPVRKSELSVFQKDSVISVVKRTYDYALRALERFPPGQLKDNVTFFAGPMNKLQIINLINDH